MNLLSYCQPSFVANCQCLYLWAQQNSESKLISSDISCPGGQGWADTLFLPTKRALPHLSILSLKWIFNIYRRIQLGGGHNHLTCERACSMYAIDGGALTYHKWPWQCGDFLMNANDKNSQKGDGYDPSNDCCKQEKFKISFLPEIRKVPIRYFI